MILKIWSTFWLYETTETRTPKTGTCRHGVAWKAVWGVPKCVLQKEAKNVNDQRAVWGTVKAPVLEVDPGFNNLITTSVYDAKPIHYLSMVSWSIEWVVEEKRTWSKFMTYIVNSIKICLFCFPGLAVQTQPLNPFNLEYHTLLVLILYIGLRRSFWEAIKWSTRTSEFFCWMNEVQNI